MNKEKISHVMSDIHLHVGKRKDDGHYGFYLASTSDKVSRSDDSYVMFATVWTYIENEFSVDGRQASHVFKVLQQIMEHEDLFRHARLLEKTYKVAFKKQLHLFSKFDIYDLIRLCEGSGHAKAQEMATMFKQIKTIIDTTEAHDRSVLEKKRKAVSDASVHVDLTKPQNTNNILPCPSSPIGRVATNATIVTPEAPDNKKRGKFNAFQALKKLKTKKIKDDFRSNGSTGMKEAMRLMVSKPVKQQGLNKMRAAIVLFPVSTKNASEDVLFGFRADVLSKAIDFILALDCAPDGHYTKHLLESLSDLCNIRDPSDYSLAVQNKSGYRVSLMSGVIDIDAGTDDQFISQLKVLESNMKTIVSSDVFKDAMQFATWWQIAHKDCDIHEIQLIDSNETDMINAMKANSYSQYLVGDGSIFQRLKKIPIQIASNKSLDEMFTDNNVKEFSHKMFSIYSPAMKKIAFKNHDTADDSFLKF